MKILIDMNLSPEWLPVPRSEGFDVIYWSDVGAPTAVDTELFEFAKRQGAVLLTQDLDFAELLFHAQSGKPSAVLLRLRNELDASQQRRVAALIRAAEAPLKTGALLVIDERRARLRRLPIGQAQQG